MSVSFHLDIDAFKHDFPLVNRAITQAAFHKLNRTRTLLRESGWFAQNNMRDNWHPDPHNPNESAEDYWCEWRAGSGLFQASLIIAYTDWIGGLSMDDVLYDHELPTIKKAQALVVSDWLNEIKPIWS